MYVIVFQHENIENKEIIIYSLTDTSRPIIKLNQPKIKLIDHAFMIKIDDD